MVNGTNTTRQDDEDTSNEIAHPHGEPCLPPIEPESDDGAGTDHPGVDVETVGNPEEDKVVPTPCPAGGFNGLQIMVE